MRTHVLIAAFFTLTGCYASAQQLAPTDARPLRLPPNAPAWVNQPLPILPTTGDATEPQVRAARSRLFDFPVGSRLGDASPTEETGGEQLILHVNPLPTSADAIVITSGDRSQPFLSADHRRVYSDLDFVVSRVIKDLRHAISVGSHITVSQSGGTAILPGGKTIKDAPIGNSSPVSLHTPYLLFLRYNPVADTYMVQQSWDISGPKPIPQTVDGRNMSEHTLAQYGYASPGSVDDLVSMINQQLR